MTERQKQRRFRGYRGMPRGEWRDWRQAAETFVAENRVRDPDATVRVLVGALRRAQSWAELVAGLPWLMFATRDAHLSYVPGYGEARTLRLLDRFVRWLHARGDIGRWTRDVLRSAIDMQRVYAGLPPRLEQHFNDHYVDLHEQDRLAEELAARVSWEREGLARSVVDYVVAEIERQIGPGYALPIGALDADRLVHGLLEEPFDHAHREVLGLCAELYRMLGETQRLDAGRASHLAERLSWVALSPDVPLAQS